ncbi:MAG: hypothetical protein ABFE08_16205 [Armatimonadia bacterium]
MEMQKSLDQYVEVGRRFLRSVSLEQDARGNGTNGDYVLTANARQALHRLAEGLSEGSVARAWTITGPYGVGKSAFAVFLTRLLCLKDAAGDQARQKLLLAAPDLAETLAQGCLRANGNGTMLPVLVTARRAPAAACLLQGMLAAIAGLEGAATARLRKRLAALLKALQAGAFADSRDVVGALQELAAVARAQGYTGLLVIVDELGKLFEYAARDPRRGDVFVLQELAEYASRSGVEPVLFLGFLHQAFEEYGQHLDAVTRREWEKIGGRFHDVPFLEPVDQVVRMIASALRPTGRELPASLAKRVQAVARAAAPVVAPPGMPPRDFERLAVRAYPLHPVTLVALPYLFRRFAQNERSLFAYLSSQEPYALQDFLRAHTAEGGTPAFVRLPDLFDYFVANFGTGLYRHPQAKRWLEAVDVLDRRSDLTDLHKALVKSTGILNALGEFSHLQAHQQVLSLVLSDQTKPPAKLEDSLAQLREKSVLTFRTFTDAFQIWEGSDVDIDERLEQGATHTRDRLSLAENIRHYLPPRPLVARRHSFETGALRHLAVAYLDDPSELSLDWKASETAPAHVAVCLAYSLKRSDEFVAVATAGAGARHDLLVAVPQEIGELRAAVQELAALRWVWDNTPELRDDRVARREISIRISEAEQVLLRDLDGLLDPRPAPRGSQCLWFWGGQQKAVRTPTDVSKLVSDVCDSLFPKSPRIRNELIARRTLSAAATAARRNLIERMLTRAGEPLLGLEGYPPERSMYESVLLVTGLHREDDSCRWGFHPPDRTSDAALASVWEFLDRQILADGLEPVQLDGLFAGLAAPPIGVPEGLHPVLLCAFMLAYPDETTLYREGTFLPEVGIADFEVLMRRPELYAIAGGQVTGARAEVVGRLARSLQVNSATLPVVRALFRMVRSLPELAWHTQELSAPVVALREAFAAARSPEQLLFADLPGALGFPAFGADETETGQVQKFFERLNGCLREWGAVAPTAIASARDTLLRACNLPAGEAGWDELRGLGDRLRPWVREPRLAALLARMQEVDDTAEGVETVLALVAQRPPRNWSDLDRKRFPEAAEMVGALLRSAAATMRSASVTTLDLPELLPAEMQRAQALSDKIMKALNPAIAKLPAHVVKAALKLAAGKIGDTTEDE